MSELTETTIGNLFEFTIPGDWGLAPTGQDDIPVVRSTNFRNDGRLDLGNLVYRKIEASRLAKRRIRQGDVLFEKSGGGPGQPAGRVVYCDVDFGGTCSNFIELARIRASLDKKFVFYLLFHLYETGRILKYQQQTTGIINFKLNEYKLEIITLPKSKSDQTQIASVLSCIDRAIEQTEIIIAKQQRIKTGLMQDLLTKGIDGHGNVRSEKTHKFKDSPLGRIPEEWEVTSLYDVGEWFSGGTPSKAQPRFWNGAIPWISSKDMKQFHLRESIDHVTKDGANSGTRIVPKDTILIVVRGMVLAHTFPVGITTQDMAFNQDLKACVCNPSVSPLYLAYSLLSNSSSLLRLATEATHGTKRIDSKDLFSFKFAMPKDEKEQQSIVKILETFDMQIRAGKDQRDKLSSVKQGIMQDLILGRKGVEALLEIEHCTVQA
ncbi:MAG: restriction endonuclease subunit S [Chitinophagaceae bacterium]